MVLCGVISSLCDREGAIGCCIPAFGARCTGQRVTSQRNESNDQQQKRWTGLLPHSLALLAKQWFPNDQTKIAWGPTRLT